jgi:hypothetical protein
MLASAQTDRYTLPVQTTCIGLPRRLFEYRVLQLHRQLSVYEDDVRGRIANGKPRVLP